MIMYFIKRLLQFIPVMFIVSLLAFYISVNAPGDPVEILSQQANAQGANANYTTSRQYKDSVRVRLGLNLPLFYLGVGTANDCDTLYRVTDKQERYALYRLGRKYGNWKHITGYRNALKQLQHTLSHALPDSIHAAWLVARPRDSMSLTPARINQTLQEANNIVSGIAQVYNTKYISLKLDSLNALSMPPWFPPGAALLIQDARKNFSRFTAYTSTANNYIPQFHWYGSNNQYHRWLVNLGHGDFGYSYTDTRPVANKIWQKFIRSFTLVLFSVLLAYGLSIPLGVYSAKRRGKLFDRAGAALVFLLYAIPSFFFGTLLLYFFSNPAWFLWFPESGFCDPEHYDPSWSWVQKVYYTFPYMVLPLVTYTYASFAFISRMVRSATLDVLGQDFIRTARAKGLSENRVLWRHAFRNALLPVITTFVNVLPAAIGGSIIIETIFSYDGMGMAGYQAVTSKDYPMLVSIFTLAGIMSMLAYFIGDILYAMADPRIIYKQRK